MSWTNSFGAFQIRSRPSAQQFKKKDIHAMEIFKAIGFQVERLANFATKVGASVSSDLDNIFISFKNLDDLIKKISDPKNCSALPNCRMLTSYSALSPIPCRELVEKVLSEFSQIESIWEDCYLFYRSPNLSFEPLIRQSELFKLLEEAAEKAKTNSHRKRKKNFSCLADSKNIEPPLKKIRCGSPDMFVEEEENGLSEYCRAPLLLKRARRTKRHKTILKERAQPKALTRADEIFLNPYLYDWKQRTKWHNTHPLNKCTVDSLLRHVIFIEIIANPPVLHEWLRESEDWIALRQIMKDFMARESKIVKNNGYARLLRHHLKGIPCEPQTLIPIDKKLVGLYISDILRRVLPMKLFNDVTRVRKKMIKAVVQLIFGAKDEGFLLQTFTDCLDLEAKWLVQIPSFFRETMAKKIVKFLIEDYVLVILRNNFFITETGSTGFKLFYYRKPDIESISFRTLTKLMTLRKLVEVEEEKGCIERNWLNGLAVNATAMKQSDFLPMTEFYKQPVAKFRFLPKTPCGGHLRIITTAPKLKLTGVPRVFQKRREKRMKQLTLVKLWLDCILNKIGTGIRPLPSDPKLMESWSRIRTLKETGVNGGNFYYVKADITDAFGSVCHDKLFGILDHFAPDHTKDVMAELIISEWAFCRGKLVKLTRSSFSRQIRRKRLLHSRRLSKTAPHSLQFFKDVIKQVVSCQLLRFGKKTFKLSRGLPQGGVGSLSPYLCDLYYSALDHEYFHRFLSDEYSILLRAVDDYLFISVDKEKALTFYNMVEHGFPEYGTSFKKDKLSTNLMQGSSFFRYLGLLFDVNSLTVMPIYDRNGLGLISYMKLSNISQDKHFSKVLFIKNKLKLPASLKLEGIVFNKGHEDLAHVRRVLLGACCLQVQKALELSRYLHVETSELVLVLQSVPWRLYYLVLKHTSVVSLQELKFIVWQSAYTLSHKFSGVFPGLYAIIKSHILKVARSFRERQLDFFFEILNNDVCELLGAK